MIARAFALAVLLFTAPAAAQRDTGQPDPEAPEFVEDALDTFANYLGIRDAAWDPRSDYETLSLGEYEDFEGLRPHLSDAEIADLTLLIGTINSWNRLSIGLRTQHPHDRRKAA